MVILLERFILPLPETTIYLYLHYLQMTAPTLLFAVETYRHKSIGTLLRCACAFGAASVIIVGSPTYSTHGAHGAQNHVEIIHFYYWNDCIEYCRNKGCAIYSISPIAIDTPISDSQVLTSVSVDRFVFSGSACFVVGERDGLTLEQLRLSDKIFHVAIPCSAYEDKVVYDSKVAICLQQYASTADLIVRGYKNEKHELGEINFYRPRTIKAGKAYANKKILFSDSVITSGESVARCGQEDAEEGDALENYNGIFALFQH